MASSNVVEPVVMNAWAFLASTTIRIAKYSGKERGFESWDHETRHPMSLWTPSNPAYHTVWSVRGLAFGYFSFRMRDNDTS
jgi:hypothetical protein